MARAVATHPAFSLIAAPAVAAWLVLDRVEGPHTAAVDQVGDARFFQRLNGVTFASLGRTP